MTDQLDDDASAAATELVGRCGATELQVGWTDDDEGRQRWFADARFVGGRVIVEDHDTPDAALQGLIERLVHGGRCAGCGKLCALSDDPVPIPAQMIDGDDVDPVVEKARGLCRWTRFGRTWMRGCGESAPAGSSREKLAQALADAFAPYGMIAAARAGRWDDYMSNHPAPKLLLVADLRVNGLEQLVERTIAGDFDGTPEESAAWAASEDGRAAFALLNPRKRWRANSQRKAIRK